MPLSGGLDSRLVVCKLKQLGYDNLRAYSYGLPGNYEAKAARYVAEKIRVQWSFVPLNRKETKEFFWSEKRKKYWEFADGLCSIPIFQDVSALSAMKKSGNIPKDAIFINGQSGDFITGGHIPNSLAQRNITERQLLDYIINKQFSLWLNLKCQENLLKIENKIFSLLQQKIEWAKSWEEIPALYEYWDWQERQSKYVVNEQRIYDYLNLSWQLPLWQKEYLDFWKEIPVRVKAGQKLYLDYLKRYNYKKLWR